MSGEGERGAEERWLGRLDRLIPASLLGEPEAQLRSRVLVWSCLGIGALGVVLVLVRLTTTTFDNGPVIAGVLVALVLALPWVQRLTRSHRIAGAGLVFAILATLPVLHVTAGGFPAPSLVLFPLVPLFATFLVGLRFGVISAGLVAAIVVGLRLGLAPISGPRVEMMQWSFAAVGAIVPLMCLLLAAAYEQARARGQAQLEAVNAALEEARARAEAASRSKSEFLRHVSHELRTPLNAILGYGELLQEELVDAGQDRLSGDVGKIRGASEQLLALINDLLDISRIEAGAIDLTIAAVELGPLLAQVRETALPMAAANHNTIVAATPGGLPTIATDERRLRQILLNLVSNACKFTERGRVVLEAAAADGGVTLRVRDTGVGMTPSQAAKIFEPFVQVHPSQAARSQGSGLGLSLSRRLVEALGGSIRVDSEPGRGTQFSVWLPLRAPGR